MVKIYFYDNVEGDQRLPHEGTPATAADLAELGVFATNIVDQSEVDRIAEERGYKNRDEVLSLRETATPIPRVQLPG
jgi:1,2-dihydroxy-3-keto-5-methylthiopentene dioxygenase